MEFDTRFGEDEYEPAESNECPSNKRTIQPKALNNIYNVSCVIIVIENICKF